jgi:hypothetical protein
MVALVEPEYGITKNKGLHTLVETFDRYWVETLEAYQSRDGNTVHEADIQRLKDYMDDLRKFIDYWVARQTIDQPHSSNMQFNIPPASAPAVENFQNIFWYDHAIEMYQIRLNMRQSQSRNQTQGFHPNDVERWLSYFQDRIDYFEKYVSQATPMDLPQSTSNADHHIEDLVDHTPGDSGIIGSD